MYRQYLAFAFQLSEPFYIAYSVIKITEHHCIHYNLLVTIFCDSDSQDLLQLCRLVRQTANVFLNSNEKPHEYNII